jgi:glutathione synthase
MRLVFFVNEVATAIDEYTTTRLARAACAMGHEVWYVGVGDVNYQPDGAIGARAYRARYEEGDDLTSFMDRVKEEDSCSELCLEEMDAVMLRNDSIEDLHARPWAVNAGIVFGHISDRGVCVVNEPTDLVRAATKLYLQEFPRSVRPSCYVSRDASGIRSFVKVTGATVLKPLYGTKGRNVFMVEDASDKNLSQMIEAVMEDGYVFAQARVEGAERGDLRMFLVDGEPLRVSGRYAAFRRVPPGSDPRANMSAGGKPEAAEIGDSELWLASEMRDKLRRDGMFFVGIDIIGRKVVEINAESAGGLQSVERFTGKDFTPAIVEALEHKADRHRRYVTRETTQ